MTGTGRGEFTPERIAEIEAVAWRYREDGLTHGWVHTGSSEQRDGAIGAGFTVQPLYGLDLLSSYKEMQEALRSIEQQAEQAGDPDHHTLGLVKHIARAALQSKGGE